MKRLNHLFKIANTFCVIFGPWLNGPPCAAAFSTPIRRTLGVKAGSSSSSRQLAHYLPSAAVDPSILIAAASSSTADDGASRLAQGLGYLVGAGSFLLYTPIAVRVVRQKSANGLTLSTWWLKLASYTCSDVYAYTRGYPLSTYVETLVITAEALVILLLVAYFQKSMDLKFAAAALAFGVCAVLFLHASPEIIAIGQGSSALLNAGALVPQFLLNAQLQRAGDYSPVTAALASAGCAIRLFTTIQLAGSDPILMGSYGIAFCLNAGLLAQILWYGVSVEGRDVLSVLAADIGPTSTTPTTTATASSATAGTDETSVVLEDKRKARGETSRLLTLRDRSE